MGLALEKVHRGFCALFCALAVHFQTSTNLNLPWGYCWRCSLWCSLGLAGAFSASGRWTYRHGTCSGLRYTGRAACTVFPLGSSPHTSGRATLRETVATAVLGVGSQLRAMPWPMRRVLRGAGARAYAAQLRNWAWLNLPRAISRCMDSSRH